MSNRDAHGRWLVAAGLAIGLVYLVALALVPSRFMTTDAAKYVGIGRNMLAGLGPISVFGSFFPYHSPTWPVIVMTPEVLAGVDWTVSARFLNIAGAVATLAIAGLLARGSSIVAAVLATAMLATYGYGFELARTLGLDEATAATTLLFVLLAVNAGSRRPTTWGIVLGVAFGFAFLVKETVLPLAPLPVLVTLGVAGWRPAVRLLGLFAPVAFGVTSWWFVTYASYMGTVYRVGTPAWTLYPIAGGMAVLLVIGLRVGRDRATAAPEGDVVRRERAVAWVAGVASAILLTAFFELGLRGTSSSMLRVGQYLFYVREQFGAVVPIGLLAGGGALVAVIARVRGRFGTAAERSVDALVLSLILSVPLLLVVAAVGELPRHYLAQVALLAALGAIGWAWLLEGAAARLASTNRTRAAGAWLVPVVLVAAVGASGLLLVRTVRHDLRRNAQVADRALNAAITDVGDWLVANVHPGERAVVGTILNYEIGTRLPRDAEIRIIREDQNVQPRPDGPMGLAHGDGPGTDDWVSLTMDPRHPTSFYGFRRAGIATQLTEVDGDVWIDGGIVPAGTTPPILAALRTAAGLHQVGEWTWPYTRGRELRLAAFRRDGSPLRWEGNALFLSGATLERLIGSLEAHPAVSGPAARSLADRVVLVDGERPDLVERLRRLGGS